MEQRINIKFCVRLGKTPTEIHDMLRTACRDKAVLRAQTFRWFKRFQECTEDVEDDLKRPPVQNY